MFHSSTCETSLLSVGDSFFIHCYDKVTGKIFDTNIKNIAQETKFYDFDNDDGEQKSIESFLSGIEVALQVALQGVCSKQSVDAVLANKIGLSSFIAYQMSRTPVFRNVHMDIRHGVNARLQDDGIQLPIPEINELKHAQAVYITDHTPMFANILQEMKWILVLNQTGKAYWSSDHPLTRYNPHESGDLGLLSSGIQVYFPLNPYLLLIICDPREYATADSEIMADVRDVDFYNKGQVIYSRRHLFSIDNDFDLARRMILMHPTLGDLDRPRVIVS